MFDDEELEYDQPAVAPFLVTKEHRRFAEFWDAVRRNRYIGLCYGQPGVGKTLSGRHYTGWDAVHPYVIDGWYRTDRAPPPEFLERRSAFHTPTVTVTPRILEAEIRRTCSPVGHAVEGYLYPDRDVMDYRPDKHAELLIVDEADRLKTLGLEILRDHYDRSGIGLILIGMPGIEKRLARYPQLYSRVGFVHHYRALSAEEQAFVLSAYWPELGLGDLTDYTTAEAVAAITRITSGTFRLTSRLVAQIKRILEINEMSTITKEVVEAARESLVIGVP